MLLRRVHPSVLMVFIFVCVCLAVATEAVISYMLRVYVFWNPGKNSNL